MEMVLKPFETNRFILIKQFKTVVDPVYLSWFKIQITRVGNNPHIIDRSISISNHHRAGEQNSDHLSDPDFENQCPIKKDQSPQKFLESAK